VDEPLLLRVMQDKDNADVLYRGREECWRSTSPTGSDRPKDSDETRPRSMLPTSSQTSGRSLDNAVPKHEFGVRFSAAEFGSRLLAAEAMMTSCCGKIEAQLRSLEDAMLLGRISELENLVHSQYGELSSRVQSLSEEIELARIAPLEQERQHERIQLAKKEVEQVLQLTGEMQLDVLPPTTLEADRRAASEEESLTASMDALSLTIKTVARRADELLAEATDDSEIVELRETTHMHNAIGELSCDQDAPTRACVRQTPIEAEVGTPASQQKLTGCECETLLRRFAAMKLQVDRLESETNRLSNEMNMGLLGKLSDRIEMVADRAGQLEGQLMGITSLSERLAKRVHDDLSECRTGHISSV